MKFAFRIFAVVYLLVFAAFSVEKIGAVSSLFISNDAVFRAILLIVATLMVGFMAGVEHADDVNGKNED